LEKFKLLYATFCVVFCKLTTYITVAKQYGVSQKQREIAPNKVLLSTNKKSH